MLSDTERSKTGPALEGPRRVVALMVGIVYGVGLGLARMVDPSKVLGFLDVAGAWDASLLFVLGGAVAVATVGFRLVLHRWAPRFDDRFHLPTSRSVNAALLAGASLFGIGWGLAGYCPGPVIASWGFGNVEALWFVPPMLIGAGVQRWQARRRAALAIA